MCDHIQFRKFFSIILTLAFIIFSSITLISSFSYSYDDPSVIKNDTSLKVFFNNVLVNITFDSLFINNDENLFGKGLWNFSIGANNKTADLLVNQMVTEGQTINFTGKSILLEIPKSNSLYLFSQPFSFNDKSGKFGLLDSIIEKYNQTNNFGNGSHIAIPDDGKKTTFNINFGIYKYTAIINKDPDYILKYHIKTLPT